jgi:murein L,D-transpeptidase YafK
MKLIRAWGLIALGVGIAGVVLWSHWPAASLPANAKVDLVVVTKSARRLDLYRGGSLLKSYSVSLGAHPLGPKQRQGDGKTPEGQYVLDNRNPKSTSHLALHISYPSPADRAAAKALGVDPGGQVMVHGIVNGLGWLGRLHLALDWTDGCVAVTNQEMDEIWRAVPTGTRIILKP